MKLKKLDALLVPRADMYSGEEVPEDEERLKYITNFSGSAGYAIISANSSCAISPFLLFAVYKLTGHIDQIDNSHNGCIYGSVIGHIGLSGR